MGVNNDIDPALLGEFIDESLQGLLEVGNLFISLEQNPEDIELVQSIFRIIHSMKGNSAFFGFDRVKTLSHEMESILDLVRTDELGVDENISTVLLEGCDALQNMLDRVHQGGEEITDEQAFEELVLKVMALSGTSGMEHTQIAENLIKQLNELKDALPLDEPEVNTKLDQLIADAEQLLPEEEELSADLADREPWPKAYRDLYVVIEKWDSTPDDDSKAIAARELLEQLHKICTVDSESALLTDALDNYNLIYDSIGMDPLLKDTLNDALNSVSVESLPQDAGSEVEDIDKPISQEAPEEKKAGAADKGTPQQLQKTMRIPEEQIDLFLSYVGELLVIGDMFDHLHRRLVNANAENEVLSSFKIANSTFATLSNELQNSIMAIRKVPMSALLSKAPRIIRDIATSKGKKIEINIKGDSIMLDKSLMDILDAPLTHMVRNAADHGIELPEDRERAGKDPTGQVDLIANETSTSLELEIKDDGAGLDLTAIQEKATEMGLIQAGATLSQKDLVNFIFRSGVSTATEVTDVSGRGVGMDAVRRSVEEAGGNIEVETTEGSGSVFRITLPKTVTTRIMEGFLIRCGQLKFIIPMNRVIETSLFGDNLITVLPNGHKSLKRHNSLYPLVSLANTLGHYDGSSEPDDTSVVVTITSRNGAYALHVDEVLGVQKVVAREIKGIRDCGVITGGALMGDGSISFILDMDEIMNVCSPENEALVASQAS